MGLDMQIFVNDSEEIYWRKEYRLRNWFSKLDNFEYYGTTKLTKENIKDLIKVCEKVINDYSLVDELLPFKDQETANYCKDYDKYFYYDLGYTVKELKKILNYSDNSIIEYWEG